MLMKARTFLFDKSLWEMEEIMEGMEMGQIFKYFKRVKFVIFWFLVSIDSADQQPSNQMEDMEQAYNERQNLT